MEKLLALLEQNARLTNAQLAVMTGKTEEEVAAELAKLEADGIIHGYQALIDWEKAGRQLVEARIEIKVVPKRDMGFDEIAGIIAGFSEVSSVYLMSGGYDIGVTVIGKSFRDIAMFVAQRLAVLDSVQSTATHFVLNKYKEKGVLFMERQKDEREVGLL